MRWRRVMAVLAALLLGLGAWLWTPDIPRATLEARYLAAATDLRTVAGTTLHVRDSGPRDAPAIVLLHGFGASLHTWESWAQVLQAQYRVLRFDLPGHGLSPPDATGDYSDARSLQLLAALMDQMGVAQAHLIGHSMGGRIAWSFAARQPQRVARLVLVAPDGFASPGFEYGKAPEVGAVAELMRWALPRPLLRMSLAPAYADPAAMTEDRIDRYHDLLLAPGARQAILDRMRQLVLQDPVPWLQRITAPTLLLWGQQDQMIPVANAADYQRAVAQTQLVVLPRLGHLPHEEDPARSLPPVQAFLAGQPLP